MNKRIRNALIAVALTAGAVFTVTTLQPKPTRMLIPLYQSPPGQFAQVAAANTYNNIDAILNPANGPGAASQARYVDGIALLKSNSVGIYGYVYTSYGARSAATVKAQIDQWQSWYGVDGIFLDEAGNTASQVSYYADLYNYTKAKGLKVILNPGTNTIEAYAPIADAIVIYENSSTVCPVPASWTANYPASKFGALQYAASADQMRTFVALAKSKNIGYIYVTDDVLANPWDRLPAYLSEEAALLAGGVVPPTLTPAPVTSTSTSTLIPPSATSTATPTYTATLTPLPMTFTPARCPGALPVFVGAQRVGDYCP